MLRAAYGTDRLLSVIVIAMEFNNKYRQEMTKKDWLLRDAAG